MKSQDLLKHHHMSATELEGEIHKLVSQLKLLSLEIKAGQHANPHSTTNLKRAIAQLKTILHHKRFASTPSTTKQAPKVVAKKATSKTADTSKTKSTTTKSKSLTTKQ